MTDPVDDQDTPPHITADVTCRTEGCPAAGVTYRVVLYENPVEPKYRSFCAGCQTYNEDIVEVTDA